jgi:hypothetical protein
MANLVIEHLLDLTQHFVPKLAHLQETTIKPWSATLALLHALSSPSNTHDGRALPPTAITQYLQLHFLPQIYLSSFLLAWAPTFPPQTFQETRSVVKDRLLGASNKVLILRTLWRAIRLADGKSGDDKTGWNRVWPTYAKVAASKMVDLVIINRGGVRGLVLSMIGEEAVLAKQPRESLPRFFYFLSWASHDRSFCNSEREGYHPALRYGDTSR